MNEIELLNRIARLLDVLTWQAAVIIGLTTFLATKEFLRDHWRNK